MQGKLVYIKDEHIANQIMEVLRRVRIREAGDKGLGSSEIGEWFALCEGLSLPAA